MIIQQVTDDRPQDEIGQAYAQTIEVKTIPDEPLDPYCLCDLGLKECAYREPAFYGGSNKYENDYTSFYVNKVDASDEIKFFLINLEDNSELELVSGNENEYGTYFDGPGYSGVLIEFDKLINNFNSDLRFVSFRTEQNVFGTELKNTSHEFNLLKFDPISADSTVRIETINSGRIESGNDYENLNWKRSIRLSGIFGKESPSINVDNYQDGERTIKQIQDSIENEYTFETELIPNQIFKAIVFNDLLANEIFISDYNIKNANYKGVAVSPVSLSSNYYEKNASGSYEITFTDRTQNNVKRNV